MITIFYKNISCFSNFDSVDDCFIDLIFLFSRMQAKPEKGKEDNSNQLGSLKRLANFWFPKKDLKGVISYGQTGDPSRNNCNKKLRKRNKEHRHLQQINSSDLSCGFQQNYVKVSAGLPKSTERAREST